MQFALAIDAYITEQRAEGRFTSPRTEHAYRRTLELHAQDAASHGHHDAASTNRADILTTLARWDHPATKRNRRAHLVGFYNWTVRAHVRPSNPAHETRGPKRRTSSPLILGPHEIAAVLAAARTHGGTHWWATEILAGAGLRNAELRGLQVRDLARHGYVHIRPENGKGGRERWIPTGNAIQAVRANVTQARTHPHDHIICARQTIEVGVPDPEMREYPDKPISPQGLMRMIARVSDDANIGIRITPHMLRHHYGHTIASTHGIWVAQALLGHADVGTTVAHYAGRANEHDVTAARHALDNATGWPAETSQAGTTSASLEQKAPTGVEPVYTALQAAA